MITQLAALFILVTPLKITSVIISLILFSAVYFCVKNIYETPVKKIKSWEFFIALLHQMILILDFYVRTTGILIERFNLPAESLKLQSIINSPAAFSIFITGVLFAALSFNIIYAAAALVTSKSKDYNLNLNYDKESMLLPVVICFISAFGVLTMCTKSSFLYPFQDFGDINCYLTVGKSMMNGIVPYRDLFEQKGPLLYFIYGLAWLISHDTFIGAYMFEVLAGFIFLFYSYKIMRLYADRDVIILIPVLALICYTSTAFRQGGDVEELSMPLASASLYIFLRAAKNNKILSIKEAVLIGVLSGLIFWSKFVMTGLYAGWFIIFMITCINDGKLKEFFKTWLAIFCGVMIATLPFIIYFAANHAVKDWLEVYIYDNLFLYSARPVFAGINILLNPFKGLLNFLSLNNYIFYLCFIGMIFITLHETKRMGAYIISMFAFAVIFLYIGGVFNGNYSVLLNIFAVFGLVCVYNLFKRLKCKINLQKISLAAVTCIILALIITPNNYLLGVDKSEFPQYKFAEIIRKIKPDNPTLLNYRFMDCGLYTTANIFPNCKAFFKVFARVPEMDRIHEEYAEKGLCDFIVTHSEYNFEKYELIAQSGFNFKSDNYYAFIGATSGTYYLYKHKDL